ncbi:sulfatase/phosphatase domain-containing protein [Paenibacillus hemerocallicola]|jgi:arylsulfatase A-like enzyme|nr:sulfatase/phosphatase domain-containing protein [Paenibacillus hemerocallicola]
MYYRYWTHLSEHKVYAHYGLRTEQYKLIYYYADALGTSGSEDERKEPEWELFDLKKDPYEMINVYADPDYSRVVAVLEEELYRLQEEVKDEKYERVG